MARQRQQFLAHHFYHLYNRGVNHERIFFLQRNYIYLLRLIQRGRKRYPVSFVAYCLMPNHYHLLVEPLADDVISPFMKHVFQSYVQGINRQQQRDGPLFRGRYEWVEVDEESYFRHVARYIHVNPVEAGLAASPERWQYSNYRDILGLRHGTLVSSALVPDRFANAETYRSFVEEHLEERKEIEGLDCYLLD
jgi:putative transposase